MKKLNSWILLLAGILLIGIAHLSINVEILAWVASVPFLIYLSKTQGFLSRLWFVLALIIGWSLAIGKIMTDPLPWFMTPVWSIPIALIQAPAYLIWAKWKDKKYSLFIFPAVAVVLEWIQYTFTPLGSWGCWGYTQIDNLTVMQLTSVFGLAGVSFIIHFLNISMAKLFIDGRLKRSLAISLGVIMAACLIFGSLRFDIYNAQTKSTIKVATIGSDCEVFGLPLPEKSIRNANVSKLFERTVEASKRGAQIIVWNEAAAVILKDEEISMKDSIKQIAQETNSTVVGAYNVLVSETPFRYEIRYVIYNPQGDLLSVYNKHQPVPGEPAPKGQEPAVSLDLGNTQIAGAICYDYDFPYLAKRIGDVSADIVVLPSSDWKGIDPIHTRMAAVRAIEQGHSIIRSTRFGLSAAINPTGTLVGQQSSFDENDKILVSDLPVDGIGTIYSVIGDLLVYLCIGFILVYIGLVFSKFGKSL